MFETLDTSVTLIAHTPEDFFQAHKTRHPGAYNFEPRANRRNDWTAVAHVMNMSDARMVAASFSGYSVSNAGDAFCRIFIPLKKPMVLQSDGVKRTVSPSTAVMAQGYAPALGPCSQPIEPMACHAPARKTRAPTWCRSPAARALPMIVSGTPARIALMYMF